MPGQSNNSNKDKEGGSKKDTRLSPARSSSTRSQVASGQKSPSVDKGNENNSKSEHNSRGSQRDSKNRSRPVTSESSKDKADNTSTGQSHKNSNDGKKSACVRSEAKTPDTSSRNKDSKDDNLKENVKSEEITDGNSHHSSSVEDYSVLNYSDIDFRPYGYGKPVLDARAVLHVGPDPCSCYPRTSSRTVPSMLYDQVRCVHHGHLGYAHEGVCDFDDGWTIMHEQDIRPRTQIPEEKGYFMGYPQPLLDQELKSRRSSKVSEKLKALNSETSNSQLSVSEKGRSQNGSATHTEEPSSRSRSFSHKDQSKPESGTKSQAVSHDAQGPRSTSSKDDQGPQPEESKSVTSSQRWNMKLPRTPDSRPTTKDIPINLPQIGYPLTPSNRNASPASIADKSDAGGDSKTASKIYSNASNESGERKPVTMFTPVDEENGTTHHDSATSNSRRTHSKDINKNRTFAGKYYDPVKDQVYSYEVTHEFGKHINRWASKKECKSINIDY